MKCAICNEETIGTNAKIWGCDFAHVTCIKAYALGANNTRAAAPTEAKPACSFIIDMEEGGQLAVSVPAQQDAVDARLVYASPIFTTAIDALNKVKAWRDCDGNAGFPHDVRAQIDAVLMAYEMRAAISAKKGGAA